MELGKTAKELGFVRDTLEKICRLTDVLRFFENDDLLSQHLALKGGTAINLTMLDLPRLSVDIDLDFSQNVSREEMLTIRKKMGDRIYKYMGANGYQLSLKSKNHHALDSFVYEYQNAGGMKDNLKIEINYMLRCHVLPVERRTVSLPWMSDRLEVLAVNPIEIFGAKIVALLTRTAVRDLYDVHNMISHHLFDKTELEMLRKCVIFYSAIGTEKFELSEVQNEVRSYLSNFLIPTNDDRIFWSDFARGIYSPQLVFEDSEVQRIINHPMALWKCRNNEVITEQAPVMRKGR